ncbi:thiolase family protein [Streptomyces sp. 8N616]|uniref:thiolase family protein n=1 Tax=Streptomyces sp. 8N616 TaxID=3457414 RepID=UPI003FD1BE71
MFLARMWHGWAGSPRERQDRYALASHQKAVAAAEAGRYDAELMPVPVRVGEAAGDRGK